MSRVLPISEVERICQLVLAACGVPADDIRIITESVIDAHKRGRPTHGIGRLPIYVRRIRNDQMSAATRLSVDRKNGVVTLVDANNGFGQVAAMRAMQLAIASATEFGLGAVAVRNSNSFGAAGFIAEAAAKAGMIGVVMSNSGPAMAPTGGNKPLLGTNPLAIAFPGGELGFPISLDMATSAVARSKIRLAAKAGEQIPTDWALDEAGRPTDDPVAALRGMIKPLGGHKGYGLSLAIDILAGLLAGAAFGGEVQPLNCASGKSNCGHFICAINIPHFMAVPEYEQKLAQLVRQVRSSGEPGKVLLPGEASHARKQANQSHVAIPESILAEIDGLLAFLDLRSDE